jgi:uncharacterized protein (DUF2345 family)
MYSNLQNKLFVDEKTVMAGKEDTIPESRLELITPKPESTESRTMKLSSGRKIVVEQQENGDRITLQTAGDYIELEIMVTEKGPVLRFQSADLLFSSSGKVAVECEDFHVKTKQSLICESEGDLKQIAKSSFSAVGKVCSVQASRGDVKINANDDVRVKGERIRLNC